jgi:hypothetical protein
MQIVITERPDGTFALACDEDRPFETLRLLRQAADVFLQQQAHAETQAQAGKIVLARGTVGPPNGRRGQAG